MKNAPVGVTYTQTLGECTAGSFVPATIGAFPLSCQKIIDDSLPKNYLCISRKQKYKLFSN